MVEFSFSFHGGLLGFFFIPILKLWRFLNFFQGTQFRGLTLPFRFFVFHPLSNVVPYTYILHIFCHIFYRYNVYIIKISLEHIELNVCTHSEAYRRPEWKKNGLLESFINTGHGCKDLWDSPSALALMPVRYFHL